MMDEGLSSGPITPLEVANYPGMANLSDNIVVLGLTDDSILQWINLQQWPTFMYLDEDLRFVMEPGFIDVLDVLDATL